MVVTRSTDALSGSCEQADKTAVEARSETKSETGKLRIFSLLELRRIEVPPHFCHILAIFSPHLQVEIM